MFNWQSGSHSAGAIKQTLFKCKEKLMVAYIRSKFKLLCAVLSKTVIARPWKQQKTIIKIPFDTIRLSILAHHIVIRIIVYN